MVEHSQEDEPLSESEQSSVAKAPPKLMFFGGTSLDKREVVEIPSRSLAHLGDAVFHLFEREREIKLTSSVKQMHVRARVSAETQSTLLETITPHLHEDELEIVRRARNVKVSSSRKNQQATYRRATAFEALLGYLYLTDANRLQSVLDLTLAANGEFGAAPPETTN